MKIAIIGGGVCGLYLAWKLAEKGEQVIVFEKNKEIGKKICSGLFSQNILNYIPQAKNLIQNKIDYTFIHFPKKSVKIRFSKKFFVMSHYELDNLTAVLAQKAGAKIVLDHKINSLPPKFDKIIGCDGASSITRKCLNLPYIDFRLTIQGFIKRKDNSNFVETWAVKSGFLWKIPRGEETEYGIIADTEKSYSVFNKFLTKNNIKLQRINSAIVADIKIKKLKFIVSFDPSVTLCGEAAGLIKPWSGGGVIWGLKSCDLLLKHFPDFLSYSKAIKRFFIPEIVFSCLTTKLAYFSGFHIPWILPSETSIEGDYFFKKK